MSLSFPTPLLNELIEKLHPFDDQAFILAHTLQNAPVSIRRNTHKKIDSEFPFPILSEVAWAKKQAVRLQDRPIFAFDPLWHAGQYYVQEASSMMIGHAFEQHKPTSNPIKVLDLCAAPGGKSTHLASLLNSHDVLVCNEPISARAGILLENLTRWGQPNIIVTQNDPADYEKYNGYFDVILVDAPCSGSGLFRRDNNAINEWSTDQVEVCNVRQKRILQHILPCLANGGLLLYSTCSFSFSENEDVVDWILDKGNVESLPITMDEDWGWQATQSYKHQAHGYRAMPHKVQGEGLFIAAFRSFSIEAPFTSNPTYKKPNKPNKTTPPPEDAEQYIIANSDLKWLLHKNKWYVMPINTLEVFKALDTTLYVRKAGLQLGEPMRNGWQPNHDLALSTLCNINNLPSVGLTLDLALQYLRGDNEIPNTSNAKGWNLITYKNIPLGWAKFLQNRMNNYLPKEYRLRKNPH